MIQMPEPNFDLATAPAKRNGQNPTVMTFGKYFEFNQASEENRGSLSLR
jgi:hypothetical protein